MSALPRHGLPSKARARAFRAARSLMPKMAAKAAVVSQLLLSRGLPAPCMAVSIAR